jgi:DNA-binding GntR family transcriptional regulator
LRLSCDQLVEFQDQRGFRVPQVSALRLRELTHLRIVIEREAALLSLANGGLEWEANLTAAYHKLAHVEASMHDTPDPSAYMDVWCACEWGFHNTLISACGSETFLAAYRDIYDRQRQQLVMAVENSGYREGNIIEHRAIVDAALARDSSLCAAQIETHLLTGLKALKEGVI